jgi:UDP-2,3-diacylglucosamine pyrophosphatase LpxH
MPQRPQIDAAVPLRPRPVRHHRTLFVSDTHLGTRGCKARALADFLAHNECETLYLVGDIIDGWQLKRGWYWDAQHSRALDLIVRKAENGTRVIYVPGNHDEMFRPIAGAS